MRTRKILVVLAAALFMLGVGCPARAGLNAVDTGPYEAGYGFFPKWYQDEFGMALDLCLSKSVILPGARPGLTGGDACTLLANPGIFDPASPILFPSNFPDESFWFMAEAAVTTPSGADLLYVSNLEAAFGGGNPAPNDQVSFARIRIRVTLPADIPPGTYTITHPYGVEMFELQAGGTKVINMTRDIGIAGPGEYTGALAGDIGPFLMDESVPSLGPIPGTNPLTGATEHFIGDPNTSRRVVGSPFGTNYVLLEGPAGFEPVQTDLFTVMGKLSDIPLPTPVSVERATYSLANGPSGPIAQQDVFAKAPPTADPVSLIDANGISIPIKDANFNGRWVGQSRMAPVLPANVVISAANPASNGLLNTVQGALVDLVSITRAEYSNGTLIVEATSSDEVAIPEMMANGQPMAPVGAGPLQTATITGLIIPPANVTVISANGGSDTEAVLVLP